MTLRRDRKDRIYLNRVKRERWTGGWPRKRDRHRYRKALRLGGGARAFHYDRKGRPIDMLAWAKAFEDETRLLRQSKIGPVFVSTVWLGIDHAFGDGRPLIFETMAFNGPNAGSEDLLQWRYTYEREALIGHREAGRAMRALVEIEAVKGLVDFLKAKDGAA